MKKQPHIIILLADDLGWNEVSWNNPLFLTPNLEVSSSPLSCRQGRIFPSSKIIAYNFGQSDQSSDGWSELDMKQNLKPAWTINQLIKVSSNRIKHNPKLLRIHPKNLFFLVHCNCASEDLRQSTSHETNGQAKTEDGVQHAPDFLTILSHCCLVVKISIKQWM